MIYNYYDILWILSGLQMDRTENRLCRSMNVWTKLLELQFTAVSVTFILNYLQKLFMYILAGDWLRKGAWLWKIRHYNFITHRTLVHWFLKICDVRTYNSCFSFAGTSHVLSTWIHVRDHVHVHLARGLPNSDFKVWLELVSVHRMCVWYTNVVILLYILYRNYYSVTKLHL